MIFRSFRNRKSKEIRTSCNCGVFAIFLLSQLRNEANTAKKAQGMSCSWNKLPSFPSLLIFPPFSSSQVSSWLWSRPSWAQLGSHTAFPRDTPAPPALVPLPWPPSELTWVTDAFSPPPLFVSRIKISDLNQSLFSTQPASPA